MLSRLSSSGSKRRTLSPRPVVKWAGGKRALVDALLSWIPAEIDTYAEPFCGGAAVFFALAAEPKRRFRRAVLADTNRDLVACYRAIQNRLGPLVDQLGALADRHLSLDDDGRSNHFYEVRAQATEGLSDVARAARLLFLNKTCYNGLWRVNASGSFNTPFGRYAKPKILDENVLRAAHAALAGVEIREGDFSDVSARLVPGDFVYFDPPYVPLSRTANFTAYAAKGFGSEDQARLVLELESLRARGVKAMLSNARSPETEELYEAFPERRIVPAPRSINSDKHKRGAVDELVVMTYAPPRRTRARVSARTGS